LLLLSTFLGDLDIVIVLTRVDILNDITCKILEDITMDVSPS